MPNALITSKMRLQLQHKFFLNFKAVVFSGIPITHNFLLKQIGINQTIIVANKKAAILY